MSEDRFDQLEQKIDAVIQKLESGQEELMAVVVVEASRLDKKIDDLDRHMHVLHEETRSQIAALPEATHATKTEVAELADRIERRLNPLEAAVRHHSTEIASLKEARNNPGG